MNRVEFFRYLQTRSRATRWFVGFGRVSATLSVALLIPQFLIWQLAGWGSANFLPDWALILIYGFAMAVGVIFFYFFLLLTSFLEKKIKWGTSAAGGVCMACFVVGALAHSLPQLSTLVISSPVEARLQIYTESDGRRCRGGVIFGPVYKMPGGMCTGRTYWKKGSHYVFRGQGNAIAMRIESF